MRSLIAMRRAVLGTGFLRYFSSFDALPLSVIHKFIREVTALLSHASAGHRGGTPPAPPNRSVTGHRWLTRRALRPAAQRGLTTTAAWPAAGCAKLTTRALRPSERPPGWVGVWMSAWAWRRRLQSRLRRDAPAYAINTSTEYSLPHTVRSTRPHPWTRDSDDLDDPDDLSDLDHMVDD